MMQLAYIILRRQKKYTFETQVQMANEKFQNRTANRYQTFMSQWDKFSTERWVCDPNVHVEGI